MVHQKHLGEIVIQPGWKRESATSVNYAIQNTSRFWNIQNTDYDYNQEMKSSRWSLVSQLIINNQHKASFLFSVIDKLLNPTNSIPEELCSSNECDEFAQFFYDKVYIFTSLTTNFI